MKVGHFMACKEHGACFGTARRGSQREENVMSVMVIFL